MSYVNLFPAILLAGPPHTGKSVFAYHCSISLKKDQVQFILLRTTPDGEGDWFLEAEKGVGMALRQEQKGEFTPQLVERAVSAVRNRSLPMLVDVGGRPQGDQFRILRACTHYILFYRTEQEKEQWQRWLHNTGLIPVALLRSELDGQDHVISNKSPWQGVISGLDRSEARLGPTFTKVASLVRGIFDYPSSMILERHLMAAPKDAVVVVIDDLARAVGVELGDKGYWWKVEQLPLVVNLLPRDVPIALYGRGPAWLYAAIAAHTYPEPFYPFDARHFGWMYPPAITFAQYVSSQDIQFQPEMEGDALRLKMKLNTRFLLPRPLQLPPLPAAPAIILDGKAPLWLIASLVRTLIPHYPRIFLFDPRLSQPVLVWPLR